MASPLSDIVNVNITATSPGVTRAGFGVVLILSHTASWVERVRFYTDMSGVAADWAATTPEYLAAQAVFSQSPRPTRIAIGRCALKPTQKWTITPTAVNSTVYTVYIDDIAYSMTSDASATATEIVTDLKTAINAATGTHGLVATGTTTLVLTANTAGAWASVEMGDVALLSSAQDHADPGAATDLAAIQLEDDTWYAIVNPFNSKLMATAIAAWAEANTKLFICASTDTEIEQVAVGSASDLFKSLDTSNYKRTVPCYHRSNGAWFDAAYAGRCLPLDPGSETWAHKTLATVDPVNHTATQRTNVMARNGNVYVTVAGIEETQFGTVSDGEYVDVIRFIDWLHARIAEGIFGALVKNDKVAYTDQGIQLLAGILRAKLEDGVEVGGLATYTISVPKAADADPDDKAARLLKNLNFTGVLAGAAHTATVNGTVSA